VSQEPVITGSPHVEGRIPNWLKLPPDSVPQILSTLTKLQFLPFHDLSWENFERLCLRLVELDAEVEYCQLYGAVGQNQEGIDFYARSRDGTYESYQCKRLELLDPSDIRDAATRFLEGKWAKTAKVFVLCTSHDTIEKKIADEIEIQAGRLKQAGVAFRVWQRDSLSSRLKDLPSLVDDFFGRSIVIAFCGSEAGQSLGNRLDAGQIIEYRQKLRRFYSHVFISHDPALPIRGELGLGRVELAERYVVPEFSVRIASPAALTQERESESSKAEAALRVRENVRPASQPSSFRSAAPVVTRVSADAWLSQAERSVILGGPGSGKSALLRFLILDLLSDDPVLQRSLSRWASAIPVWIPFPYWTKLIATGTGVGSSLVDCLKMWFTQWDESQLWPLVERAIQDHRLLVVVDGLDEWTSQEAGQMAVQRLQWFVESRNLAAVVVSRPYGYERIGLKDSKWQVAELAPLSQEQKQELSLKWLSICYRRKHGVATRSEDVSYGDREADKETTAFMAELNASPNLSDLSSVPLLLLLLLCLHIEGVVLPRNRFEAYEYIIEHLIRDHPMRKRVASMTGTPSGELTETELHNVLAYVAFLAQLKFPTGIVPESEIRTALEGFLGNAEALSMGLTRQDTNQHLERFFRFEEGSVGLLISPVHGQFNFLHRSLQEYLAGTHVSRLSFAQQKGIVHSWAADPRWKDVILALFWRTRRPEELDELVGTIEASDQMDLDNFAKRELLAEVSFGDFNTTVPRSREIASRICDEIERSAWIPHRTQLLTHALNGLNSNKVRQIVIKRLKVWVFGSAERSWGIQGARNWPANEQTLSVLSMALRDEEIYVKRAAADALANIFQARQDVGGVIAAAAVKSLDTNDRAAALQCLIKGWPRHPELENSLALARKSEDPTLRTMAIYGRVCTGMHNDDDFAELFKMVEFQESRRLGFWWRDVVTDSLIRGWKNDQRLKGKLLDARPRRGIPWDRLDREMAEQILVSGFPGDPEIASTIADQIGQEHGFSMLSHVWKALAANFKNNATVVSAVDAWAQTLKDGREMEFAQAAAVGRTPAIKKKLIELLDKWLPFWAADTLLEVYGIDDCEVATALRSLANETPSRSSEIAQFIPKIIPDPKEARHRLLELIRAPDSRRLDFVIRGFTALAERGDEREIVDACSAAIGQGPMKPFYEMCRSALILGFPADEHVREMAKSTLASREPPLGAIAEAYANDDEIRGLVSEKLTPLPTRLRFQIAEELPEAHDAALILELLGRWDEESEAETKTLASIGYHTFLVKNHADQTEAIRRLNECIPCYGPDHDVRRQAAFPGLVLLDQMDILRSKRETIGFEGQTITIPFERGLKTNLVLVDFLAAHWDSIKASLGQELPSWFTRPVDGYHFWASMSLVAAQHSSLESDFRTVLASDASLARKTAGLSFVAKTAPKSSMLLEACLSTLKSNDTSWGWFEDVETAATLVAENFSRNADVGNELVGLLKTQPHYLGPLIALCLGWPDAPILDEAYRHFTDVSYRSLSEAAEYYVLYTKSPASGFQTRLDQDIAVAAKNVYHTRGFLEPALARIKRDQSIADHLYNVLLTSSAPSIRTSYAGLIAQTRGVSAELASWCRSQIQAQRYSLSPEIGYDVMWPGYRASVLCFLDVLDSI
jgi:energy-coupling factor transporter ATP-binding protein EcfA2